MNFTIEHIGYITKSIEKTAETFIVLGYIAEDIVNDDTQKTRICFLRKEGEVSIELVEPYPENATMLKMLKKSFRQTLSIIRLLTDFFMLTL